RSMPRARGTFQLVGDRTSLREPAQASRGSTSRLRTSATGVMRIVLTHPFCWPHVRRGTERVMEVLGRCLVADGHDVITVSTWPGPSAVETGRSGTRILHRPLTLPCKIGRASCRERGYMLMIGV